MSTVRKRKNMLRKLNRYFESEGKVLTEREYKVKGGPYRLQAINKYIGTWPRMIHFLSFYYPQWKVVEVEAVKVEVPEVEVVVVKPRVPRVQKNDE
jgi:hypothetical protein